jgi:hypothetical protein
LQSLTDLRNRLFKKGDSGTIVVAGAILAAAAYFGYQLHRHYPIQQWLFWHYAAIWACTLAFGVASLSAGLVLLDRVFRLRFSVLEHGAVAFALGVLAFEWCLFLLGAAQAYKKPIFFLLPFGLITFGFDQLRAYFRRARRLFQRAPRKPSLRRVICIGFGCAGMLMVYFTILTPENVQFDSLWKHMALAEDYVAHGGIRKATEGWIFAARPHFTSYLYAWAFLLPTEHLFDRMVLCAHLEFFTFLVTTVVGISALVRRVIPNADPSVVWAARFLFPGVFLYDSSLSAGTDHFGAMYAPVIALALFRALRALEPHAVALLAAFLAGTVITKETTALMLVPFPVLALGVRGGTELFRHWRSRSSPVPVRRLWLAPALGVGVVLLVSSPFWLKNLVIYGDPLYPNLARFFPANPWSDAAAYRMKWGYTERQMWAPSRDLDGLIDTFRALFSYSFVPNDWARSHGKVPVFGSLFTLLLVIVPFLPKARRIWLLVGWVHLALFAWFSVHHQDRYLQGIVPIMAAVVAVILVAIWQHFGVIARVAAAGLVVLQVIWGGDVYFIQTHAMVRSPIKKVVDLLSAGYERKYDERFETQRRFQKVGELVGKRARVLVHELHPHLGMGAESALDSYQWQFGIEYGAQGTPEGVRAMLRRLGITHLHFTPGKSNSVASLASDILFHEFAYYRAENPARVPGGQLTTVSDKPSNQPFRDAVLVLTCKTSPASGLYPLRSLDVFEYGPDGEKFGKPLRAASDRREALQYHSEVDWVVIEPRCYRKGEPRELGGFELAVKRRGDSRELWRRSEPGEQEEPPRKRGKGGDDEGDDTPADPSE